MRTVYLFILSFVVIGLKAQVPVASFTFTSPVCAGYGMNFYETSTNTPTSVSWQFPGGNPSATNYFNPTITYTSSGTYSVTLIATNGSGSSAPLTQTIYISAPPTLSINGSSGMALFKGCPNDSVHLSASGATSYTWMPYNIFNSNLTLATPNSSTNYTLIGTDGTCTGTQGFIIAPYTFSVSSATICTGDSANLYASGASSYTSWSPATWYNIVNDSTAHASPISTTVYTVTGVVSTCTTQATTTVTVNPLPNITIYPLNGSNICSGAIDTLIANGAMTYTWSSGNTGDTMVVIPTCTITSSPQYTVYGTDFDGCLSSGVLWGLTVNPTPVANFTLAPNSTPHYWDVYPSFSGGASPYTYSWSWGDGSPNDTSAYPSHTYTTSSWYNVCVTITDNNYCSVTYCRNDSLYKMTNSGMVYVNVINGTMSINQNKNNLNQLNVYPNPTSDQFFIEANTTDKLTVDLYDVNGRHVFNATVSDKSNINVATLDNGAYTLTIKSAADVINKKLVILR